MSHHLLLFNLYWLQLQTNAALLNDTYLHSVPCTDVFLLKKTQPYDSGLILFNTGKIQERVTNF